MRSCVSELALLFYNTLYLRVIFSSQAWSGAIYYRNVKRKEFLATVGEGRTCATLQSMLARAAIFAYRSRRVQVGQVPNPPFVNSDNEFQRLAFAFYCLGTLDLLDLLKDKTSEHDRQSWRDWIWERQTSKLQNCYAFKLTHIM